jgi:hypothetical protein
MDGGEVNVASFISSRCLAEKRSTGRFFHALRMRKRQSSVHVELFPVDNPDHLMCPVV